jgi:hypothetical protein
MTKTHDKENKLVITHFYNPNYDQNDKGKAQKKSKDGSCSVFICVLNSSSYFLAIRYQESILI